MKEAARDAVSILRERLRDFIQAQEPEAQGIEVGNLAPLTSVPKAKIVQAAADWLGVAQWSTRTERALKQAVSDPARLALLALNAPEYLVNA